MFLTNYGIIYTLDALSVAALPAKVLAEIALLAVSYAVQQRFLFARKAANGAGKTGDELPANTHIPA